MLTKEIKFLLTHSSIYGLGTVVAQLVSFLLLPLYTRYLTPGDYGILSIVEVSSDIIGIIVTVGIARALARFYYENDKSSERNTVLSTTYITYLIIALSVLFPLMYIGEPLAKLLFSSGEYGLYFRISILSLVLGGIVDIGMMYLRLIKKSTIFILITLTRLVLLIILNIIFIVHYQMGILGILYSGLIVKGIYAIGMTGIILWKTGINFSSSISRRLLSYGFPMIFSNLGSAMVKQSDKYFVLYFISAADMGIYSLALKLGNAVHNLLTVPFNMAYIPRRFEIMNRGDAKEIYSKIFTYYIFLMGYIGLTLSVLIPEILKMMVSPDFIRAKEIVPLVVLSMIIFGCHYHFDFGILHAKKTKLLAYISILCGLAQIALNIIFIRAYGLLGAVSSSIIALGLQAFLLYLVSERLYRIEYDFRRIFQYLALACIFYGISTQIQADTLFLNVMVKIILIILFPLTAILLKVISPQEKVKLKEILIDKITSLLCSKPVIKPN
jgi:O-antigen/teichoic acid export membrane protein